MLFAVVNLSRHLGVDAETALRGSNRKFTRRFSYAEQRLKEQNRVMAEASAEELDALWEEAKRTGQ